MAGNEAAGGAGNRRARASDAVNAAVRAHLKKAQTAFTEAEAALRDGDLATYQKKNEAAAKALNDAVEALGR